HTTGGAAAGALAAVVSTARTPAQMMAAMLSTIASPSEPALAKPATGRGTDFFHPLPIHDKTIECYVNRTLGSRRGRDVGRARRGGGAAASGTWKIPDVSTGRFVRKKLSFSIDTPSPPGSARPFLSSRGTRSPRHPLTPTPPPRRQPRRGNHRYRH